MVYEIPNSIILWLDLHLPPIFPHELDPLAWAYFEVAFPSYLGAYASPIRVGELATQGQHSNRVRYYLYSRKHCIKN